jgi:hypothetical protein
MEPSSKAFLSIMSFSIVAVIAATGYKFLIQKDYRFIVEAECDSSMEACFHRDCTETECPPNELEYYKTFSVAAADFPKCADNSCAAECARGAIRCEEIPCDADAGDECSSNEKEKPAEQPSGKIDEHLTIDNTLRDVNFCGKIYKVKQVLIDGVDVVQRIAEIATEDQSDSNKRRVCDGAERYRGAGYKNENEMGVTDVINNPYEQGKNVYNMMLISSTWNIQPIGDFDIDISTGKISIVTQQFDGQKREPFGTLK